MDREKGGQRDRLTARCSGEQVNRETGGQVAKWESRHVDMLYYHRSAGGSGDLQSSESSAL